MINIFLICCEPHLILRSKKSTLIGYAIKKNYLALTKPTIQRQTKYKRMKRL